MTIQRTPPPYTRFSLVSRIDWKSLALNKKIDVRDIEDVYPTTPFQKNLLYIANKSHGRFFTEVYQIGLPRSTDVALLKEVWGAIVKKHSILRTGFLVHDDDILALVYHPQRPSPNTFYEQLEEVESWSINAVGEKIAAKSSFEPFSGQPLYAVHVVGSPQAGYHLHLCLHHAIFDGASIKQLLISVHAHYHRGLADITVAPSYALIAGKMVEREESVIQAALVHYKKSLKGLSDGGWPPKGSATGATQTIIRHCATSAPPNHPPFPAHIIRVALALTMSLHSSHSDHVFCETRSSRSLLPADLQGVLGPLLYSHIVRIKCERESALNVLMDLARDKAPHSATLSLGEIFKGLDANTASKLRVFLTVYASPFWPEDVDMPGWTLLSHKAHHDAPLNIDVFAAKLGVAQVRIRYDPSLAEYANMEAFAEHFVDILRLVSEAGPNITVHDIFKRVQHAETAQTSLYGVGKPPSSTPPSLVHELFGVTARANPSRIALDFEGTASMDYAELDSLSTALANELHWVKSDTMIPLMFDVSFEMIIAIFAVLKSGGAYVPLDVNHPPARLERILGMANAKVILHGKGKEISEKIAGIKETYPAISFLKYDHADIGSRTPQRARTIDANSLAYVFFTSGSTGLPKGVAIEHRNLAAWLHSNQATAAHYPNMRKLLVSPYTFDVSVGDIFSTLTSGGTLGLVSRTKLLSNLPYWVEKMRTTHLALTASLGRQLPINGLPDLQHVIFVGETLPVDLAYNMSRNRTVTNAMGPTETVIDATEYIIPKGSPALEGVQRTSIGHPIGQTNIYILRPSTIERVAMDEVGEICIGGPQVARGYVAAADLTNAKFVPDPFSTTPGARMFRTADLGRWNRYGQVDHLGRLDGQVKLRGLRIETGEIEAVLMKSSTDIRGVYVDVFDVRGEMALVAVLAQGTCKDALTNMTDTDAVKAACAKYLPVYMRPFIWLCTPQLTVNAAGKLDRNTLRAVVQEYLSTSSSTPDTLAAAARSAQSDSETLIVTIVSRILDLPKEKVVLDASFISHGGNSLQAMMLAARLQSEGSSVSVIDCLDDTRSLATLAAFPRQARAPVASEEQSPYIPFSLAPQNWEDAVRSTGLDIDDVEDVFPIQTSAQDWLDLSFENDGRAMLLEHHFDLGTGIDSVRFKWAWEQLRLREPELRTAFIRGDNKDPGRGLPRNKVVAVVVKSTTPSRGADVDVLSAPNADAMQSVITTVLAAHRVEAGRVPIKSWLILNEDTQNWFFITSRHHSLHDARTLKSLNAELSELYANGESVLPQIDSKRSVQNSFGAFMKFITRPSAVAKQEAFWNQYLEGIGPAVWPAPQDVPQTFCKDTSTYKAHITQWAGSLPDVAKALGVSKGAIVRGAFGMTMAEKEERKETLVYEFTDGIINSELSPWGFCTDFKPTRITSHPTVKPEGERFATVVRDANRSYAETLSYIGLSWDMTVEVLGPKVSAGEQFMTSCLNIFDVTAEAQKDDVAVPQLLTKAIQQLFVGVNCPLYMEVKIQNDLVLLMFVYDPEVVKKEEAEAFVQRMTDFLDQLKATL
ncbi:putative nonribosomal peptide synthetase [Russula compacta]|nr:putative nonribosomal peptide synthetase [Russula compacta]